MKTKEKVGRSIRSDQRLVTLLNEFFNHEASFMQKVRGMHILFQQLHDFFPKDLTIHQYNQHLRMSLPSFEALYTQSQTIALNTELHLIEKIEKVTALYTPKLYFQLLSHFILLLPTFESWGGEEVYAKRLQEARLFSEEDARNASLFYTPQIFCEQLPVLKHFMQAFVKELDRSDIVQIQSAIEQNIEEVNLFKRRFEANDEINRLLTLENIPEAERAIQLYIENRLFCDPTFSDLEKEIKKYYPDCFRSLFLSLFKQIEEIKRRRQTKESKALSRFHEELKQRLFSFFEYSKDYYQQHLPNFKSLEKIGELILEDLPLENKRLKSFMEEQAENEKLFLLKCLSELSFIAKPSNIGSGELCINSLTELKNLVC